MADDRFDPEPDPAIADDDPAAIAASERWLDENHAWVKARVQEALDDPRPALTPEEVDAHLEEVLQAIEARQAR